MRIASGRTDAKLAFVAVDATDLKTRETGLSSFTVYRSRNGGTATAYTTPTVAELDATNMPGVYVLTVDEDTTITSGVDEEEYVVHITQASMAPVTRAVELFRPKGTEGNTLAVDASGNGNANVEEWNATAVPAEHTAGYPVVTVKDGTGTGEIDSASGRVAITDAQIDQIVDETWDELKSAHTTPDSFGDYLDNEVSEATPPSAATIADAVWDEAIGAHIAADSAAAHVARGLIAASQGANASDITLNASANASDDYYNGMMVVVLTGGQAGQARLITDYVGSTKVATIAPAWDDPPTGTPVVAIVAWSQVYLADNAITAQKIQNGAIDSDKLDSTASGEIADAVWDEARSGHVVAGSFGQSSQAIRSGTAQAGGANSITLDAGAHSTNNFYRGAMVEIVGGTGVGQSRRIYSYTGASRLAFVTPNWLTDPDSSSVFVISKWGDVDLQEGAGFKLDEFDFSAGMFNKIADVLWRRELASIAASSNGDTIVERSPINALRKLVNRVKHTPGSPGTLDTYEENDTTVAMSQAATTTGSVDAITELDT